MKLTLVQSHMFAEIFSKRPRFGADWLGPANANNYCRINVGLILGQRRRRWANSQPTMIQQLVFAGGEMRTYL